MTKPIPPLASWKHLGVEITFNPLTALFECKMNSRVITSPSLDALKRKIDAVDAKSFEPFYGIVRVYNFKTDKHQYSRVKVVGIVERRPFSPQFRFELVGAMKKTRVSPSNCSDVVYPDTKEARAMLAKLDALEAKWSRMEAMRKKERAKIMTVAPISCRPVDKKRIDALRKLQKLGGAK